MKNIITLKKDRERKKLSRDIVETIISAIVARISSLLILLKIINGQ